MTKADYLTCCTCTFKKQYIKNNYVRRNNQLCCKSQIGNCYYLRYPLRRGWISTTARFFFSLSFCFLFTQHKNCVKFYYYSYFVQVNCILHKYREKQFLCILVNKLLYQSTRLMRKLILKLILIIFGCIMLLWCTPLITWQSIFAESILTNNTHEKNPPDFTHSSRQIKVHIKTQHFSKPGVLLLEPERENRRNGRPTNNALLTSFRLSSDAEIFVNKHRLSITNRRQTCKNVCEMCMYSNWASTLHTTGAGWARKPNWMSHNSWRAEEEWRSVKRTQIFRPCRL